jgi:hypothetical protein
MPSSGRPGSILTQRLRPGDYYELLFTGPPESSREFDRIGPTAVTLIGEMVPVPRRSPREARMDNGLWFDAAGSIPLPVRAAKTVDCAPSDPIRAKKVPMRARPNSLRNPTPTVET